MITFKQFVAESINDRGIFKAIFIIGLPGSGKSYTASKIKGTVSPRIVNTDKAAEFLGTKWGKEIKSSNWHEFKDTSHRITSNMLLNYIDGMLPLFVDGTSNDVSNILHRMGILESLGYDVGVVFVDTGLDKAIERANSRATEIGRHVDQDFIESVHRINRENANFLKGKVSFYREVDNNSDGHLGDDELDIAFKKVQSFFNAPVINPIGKRYLEEMKAKKLQYLSPELLPRAVLAKKIEGWYKS
jgi:hypothetical protein